MIIHLEPIIRLYVACFALVAMVKCFSICIKPTLILFFFILILCLLFNIGLVFS